MDSFFGLDNVSSHDEGLELLVTVYNPSELMIIQSILNGAQIPYLLKDRGAGGTMKVIAGYSVFGTDIFVRSEELEAAEALLNFDGEDFEELEQDD